MKRFMTGRCIGAMPLVGVDVSELLRVLAQVRRWNCLCAQFRNFYKVNRKLASV
jgi:hypothetical protein